MKVYFIFLVFGFIQLKIQFEWTNETLARRPSDLIYDNHYQGQNLPLIGEFSKNAFAIVNLKAPIDLFSNQNLTIEVNAKINNEITKESAYCLCSAVQGNGFLLCEFKSIDKEIDSIQILDNKDNEDIEFDLKDYNSWVEICNGIYGNNDNTNKSDNINNSDNNNDNSSKTNLSKGAIAGITIISIVIVGGIVYLTIKLIHNNKIEVKKIIIGQDIIKEKSENINIKEEKNLETTTKKKDEDIEFNEEQYMQNYNLDLKDHKHFIGDPHKIPDPEYNNKCLFCRNGCFVSSYLHMNKLPVTEENVKLCVNDEAQFKTSNLLEEDYLQNDRIGRIDKGNNKYHFVHIKNVDSNKNTIDIYDQMEVKIKLFI